MRRFLPELLALSASSPFVEEVDTGLHSARTQIFTRTFPRCGIPDPYDGWQVRGLRRVPLPDPVDHRAHPALVERPAASRLPDRRDQDLRRAARPRRGAGLAALAYSLAVRCARAHDEGEPLPDLPNRMLEENLWRAIRYGLSGELIDFDRGEPVPTRARLEALIEWVAPVAEETGAAPFLAVPAANSAERQQARWQDGATLEEIYATEGLGDR